jgi:hypothetical protein
MGKGIQITTNEKIAKKESETIETNIETIEEYLDTLNIRKELTTGAELSIALGFIAFKFD